MSPDPRRIRCDLAELVVAFDATPDEMGAYLDLDTGEVIYVTPDVQTVLDAIYDELPEDSTDEEANKTAFAAALERRDLPDWMDESVREAEAVESGQGTRFLPLPERDSQESYRDMEAFIENVSDPGLKQRLWDAIRGRGAFRRFKDVVASTPLENERWFAFKDARMRERVLEWLADEGIEPIDVTT